MKKVINPGTLKIGNFHRQIFIKIEIDDGHLSMFGVVGPRKSGNCYGSCGQIIIGFKEYDERGYDSIKDIVLNKEWSFQLLKQMFDIWDRWHLNDMRAGCEHQRALGWKYNDHHDTTTFRGDACPECGYEIGSAWLTEDLPQEVIEFLELLPNTKTTPAWV